MAIKAFWFSSRADSNGVTPFVVAEGAYMVHIDGQMNVPFSVIVPVDDPPTQLSNDVIDAIIADAASKGVTLTGQEILHPDLTAG